MVSPISFYGNHETEMSDREADLHRHFDACKKNPGHKSFIPVNKFDFHQLPEDHRSADLCDLIKATADLTVRVDVKMISPHRPKFWPNTKVAYPFHNLKGGGIMRTGSGKLTVLHFLEGRGRDADGKDQSVYGEMYSCQSNACTCGECQHSVNPSKEWWEIVVWTAAHVVFDDVEAGHTTCKLFYDDQDSQTVTLDKLTVRYSNVEEDRCSLRYLTCEDPLGSRLYELACNSRKLWAKVDERLTNSNNRLAFLVSHPHGCPKQVSIGQWVDNYTFGDYGKDFGYSKLTYTTCTCPGSSGARVHCIGFLRHVHSGSLDSGLNYSSTGVFWKKWRN